MNFLKKIFSPLLLSSSLILMIYTFYRSEIYWEGSKRDYYFVYYFLSLGLFLISFVTFFISYKVKEYIIIALSSLIISLYFFEGYLTYTFSHYKKISEKKKIYEIKTGKKYDTRTQLEVYKDLQNKENNVSVKVSPKNWFGKNNKIVPLSSVSNSKTVYGNENGYYFIYLSDRYGFNNPDKEWDSKEIEYLLVGDSFIHGANVNRPNDISSVLRNLSNKSVLNLGYSGNGPLIQYASLREYLNPNVKKVLWFYFEDNDFIDLQQEKENNILMNYINDPTFSQNLKLKQKEIDNMVNKIINLGRKNEENFKFIKLYETRKKLLNKKKEKNTNQVTQPEDFKKIIKLTKELVVKNNSKLYFVYLPGYFRYTMKTDNRNYNSVKKIINELDVPFIDIHKEVFQKQKKPLELFPFEMYGHYNVKGYKLISEKIYNIIKNLDEQN